MSTKYSSIEKELAENHTVTYFTVGKSMEPLLCERRTVVTIAPVSGLKRNDIVLYKRQNDTLILHRFIKSKGDFLYMRGDNTYGLEKIKKSDVIGAVTHIIRGTKEINVRRNKAYKLYSELWRFIYPLRLTAVLIKKTACKIYKCMV